MTVETFNRAKEIRDDIRFLKAQKTSIGMSASTLKAWEDWVNRMISDLEEEFRQL